MHKKAKAWDKKYRTSNAQNKKVLVAGNEVFIPLNRPCDWCGKLTKEGFIHGECLLKDSPKLERLFSLFN